MNLFDGTTGLPAFDIVCAPHPDDKQFHIDEGENYYEPGMVINDCHLHEMLFNGQPAAASALNLTADETAAVLAWLEIHRAGVAAPATHPQEAGRDERAAFKAGYIAKKKAVWPHQTLDEYETASFLKRDARATTSRPMQNGQAGN